MINKSKLEKILSLMDAYAPEPELPKSTAGSDLTSDKPQVYKGYVAPRRGCGAGSSTSGGVVPLQPRRPEHEVHGDLVVGVVAALGLGPRPRRVVLHVANRVVQQAAGPVHVTVRAGRRRPSEPYPAEV